MSDVTVMGAGVAGLCVASELLERGHGVTVLDRADGHGPAQCSWWAGGMLAPWCERESAEQAVVDLGADAAAWWARRTEVTHGGTLVVAPPRDTAELARFARRTSGFDRVDADGVAALEPDLQDRFRQALFFTAEAHLSPRRALADLATQIRAAGGQIRFGVDVAAQGADPAPIRTGDIVVDARGMAAAPWLPDLRGVKGEMALIRTPDVTLSRPVRLLHPRHPIYLVPRGDGVFMLGATMIESADRTRITVRSLLELMGAAYALHPAFAEAELLETGSDVRPAFPDNLPRVVERDGRICVNGLYRHGFLLAPAMAKQVADLVARRLGKVA